MRNCSNHASQNHPKCIIEMNRIRVSLRMWDPCLQVQDTTTQEYGPGTAETPSAGRCEPSPEPLGTRTAATRGGTSVSDTPRDGEGPGGASQDGLPVRRREDPSRGRASRATGGRGTPRRSGGESIGNRPPYSAPAIGEFPRSRGEARQLPPSRCLAGTGRRFGERGGLVGPSPEALCGEAPKGQLMIRRENLAAVSGEDPQGHPKIRGCRKPHGAKSSWWQKEIRKERGPLSLQKTIRDAIRESQKHRSER